jgi:hypothetical protein
LVARQVRIGERRCGGNEHNVELRQFARYEIPPERTSYHVTRCAEVLDALLSGFNEKSGIPDKIVQWNMKGGNHDGPPLSFAGRGRLIVDVTQMLHPSKGMVFTASLLENTNEKERAPVVFISMSSPTLGIPMRLEIPLRALIRGGAPLRGTYTVYLHSLLTEQAGAFTYYGITKRNWNVRFTEHTKSAFKGDPRRRFAKRMNELISARITEITGQPRKDPKLIGIVSALCAIGLTKAAAMDTEEYLVDKYSLASKHSNGLNMIPGGRAGITALHKLSGKKRAIPSETQERERMLDQSSKI